MPSSLIFSQTFHYPALQGGTRQNTNRTQTELHKQNRFRDGGVTSFWWCPAALKGGAACSNQIGAPPWTICSRSHTRLMNAHSVHVTTKQPCKQSANKLSLLKKNYIELLQRMLKIKKPKVTTFHLKLKCQKEEPENES